MVILHVRRMLEQTLTVPPQPDDSTSEVVETNVHWYMSPIQSEPETNVLSGRVTLPTGAFPQDLSEPRRDQLTLGNPTFTLDQTPFDDNDHFLTGDIPLSAADMTTANVDYRFPCSHAQREMVTFQRQCGCRFYLDTATFAITPIYHTNVQKLNGFAAGLEQGHILYTSHFGPLDLYSPNQAIPLESRLPPWNDGSPSEVSGSSLARHAYDRPSTSIPHAVSNPIIPSVPFPAPRSTSLRVDIPVETRFDSFLEYRDRETPASAISTILTPGSGFVDDPQASRSTFGLILVWLTIAVAVWEWQINLHLNHMTVRRSRQCADFRAPRTSRTLSRPRT
ncbi:hypothetical protein DFH11DRAFT_788934 [Phellopilus nigrolimitatus]|nr:hypothetical protein DFH11DRAFT_788934 [Phellopilus nigrolimitatus]